MSKKTNILVDILATLLRDCQFKKTGNKWIRRLDEVTQVTYLQKSPYSRQYYVNLGIHVSVLDQGNHNPNIEHCQITGRLSQLTREGASASRMQQLLASEQAEQIRALLDKIQRPSGEVNPIPLTAELALPILANRPRIDAALDLDDPRMNDDERLEVVTQAMEHFGFPFFEKCSSMESICREIERATLGTEWVWGSLCDLCEARKIQQQLINAPK